MTNMLNYSKTMIKILNLKKFPKCESNTYKLKIQKW